jgi:hypothetical protein
VLDPIFYCTGPLITASGKYIEVNLANFSFKLRHLARIIFVTHKILAALIIAKVHFRIP